MSGEVSWDECRRFRMMNDITTLLLCGDGVSDCLMANIGCDLTQLHDIKLCHLLGGVFVPLC